MYVSSSTSTSTGTAPAASIAATVGTPLFDGLERVGALVVAIAAERVDDALMARTGPDPWGRLGLGASGDVVAVGSDLTLRSSPREFLEHRDQYLASNGGDVPLLKYAPSPKTREGCMMTQRMGSSASVSSACFLDR